MKNKLKPCPFCGSEDLYKNDLDSFSGNVISGWVGCNTCGVHLEKENLEEAILAWNKRIEETE